MKMSAVHIIIASLLLTTSCAKIQHDPGGDSAPDDQSASRQCLTEYPGGTAQKKCGQAAVDGREEWQRALMGISFHIATAPKGATTLLTVSPHGLEIDNRSIVKEISGTVRDLELADLNRDGSPEIYIYIISTGSGSYGSLVAYAANQRKSLSDIYLPPIFKNAAAAQGYMGHDTFAVAGQRLVRRFPIFLAADTNSNPSGGIRRIEYRLTRGEAGWILAIDRIVKE